MKKILVPTDLSPNSKTGIKFAIQFAKQIKAKLVFLYVADVIKPTSWSEERFKTYSKEMAQKHDVTIKKFVSQVCNEKQILKDAEYKIELSYNTPKSIMETAQNKKVSFICMSTRGAGKIKKLWGTNASEVITNSPIPVIVIPQRYTVAPIKSIFFACDFAALNKEMKIVQDLANSVKSKLKVFHYDYLLHVPENLKKLDKQADKFRAKSTSFVIKRKEMEFSLAEHLAGDIKKDKPSLVVLFTKQNRNWFNRLISPSEASEMSFHLKVPLLTYKKI